MEITARPRWTLLEIISFFTLRKRAVFEQDPEIQLTFLGQNSFKVEWGEMDSLEKWKHRNISKVKWSKPHGLLSTLNSKAHISDGTGVCVRVSGSGRLHIWKGNITAETSTQALEQHI